jgi:hypothetical protein
MAMQLNFALGGWIKKMPLGYAWRMFRAALQGDSKKFDNAFDDAQFKNIVIVLTFLLKSVSFMKINII